MFAMKQRVSLIALAAIATVALAPAAFGQAYPNKPIKIIAPVQPGGGVDLVAPHDRRPARPRRSASRSSSRTRAAAAASSGRWRPHARRRTATR